MSNGNPASVADLLEAISGENPCGNDLSSSSALSDIDSALGRYGTDDPKKACVVAEVLLREKSKDLRIATRYALARTIRDEYKGLSFALELIYKLIEQYGDMVLPLGGWQRRIDILCSYDNTLTGALQSISIVPGSAEDNVHLDSVLTAIALIDRLVSQHNDAEGSKPIFTALAEGVRDRQRHLKEFALQQNSGVAEAAVAPKSAPEAAKNSPATPVEKPESPVTEVQPTDVDAALSSKTETQSATKTEFGTCGEIIAESKKLASAGKHADAQKLIDAALLRAVDGKTRYFLRVALAEICIEQGQAIIASELLRRAIAEVEGGKIADWEGRGFWIPALITYYGCPIVAEERQSIFARICEIAPLVAMDLLESSR